MEPTRSRRPAARSGSRPPRPGPRVALEQLEPRETPTFIAGPTFTNGLGQPKRVVAADFNADGHADLAVANVTGTTGVPSVQILLGNGDGTFATGPELTNPL